MKRQPPYLFALSLVFLSLLGCEKRQTETAIRVIVDSDLQLGSELSQLEVRIFDVEGKVEQRKQVFALAEEAGPARYTLPMSFKLAPESQSSSYDFRIVVTGVGPLGENGTDTEVAEQQAIASFRPGETLRLDMFLGRSCLKQLCREEGSRQNLTCNVATGTCGEVPKRDDLPTATGDGIEEYVEARTDGGEVGPSRDGVDSGLGVDFDASQVQAADSNPPPDSNQPPAAYALAVVGSTCEALLEKACGDHNSIDKLACVDGRWAFNGSCDGNTRCDSRRGVTQGRCMPIADGCASSEPGVAFCSGARRRVCGPDLIDYALDQTCEANALCSTNGDVHCECTPGFERDANGNCVNYCGGNPCGATNTCQPTARDYSCLCSSYHWQPDPKRCVSFFAGVSVSGSHSCAVRRDGTFACWGANSVGQLGDGTEVSSAVPVTVSGVTGIAVAVGGGHSCVRKADGSVVCWGFNGYGQLGDGTTKNASSAVTVPSVSGVREIGAGGQHTCALKEEGTVVCWGENNFGQLGNGTFVNSIQPGLVAGLTGVAELSVGRYHNCARLSNNDVTCWGRGVAGELGNGGTANSSTPVFVSGLSATSVSAGGGHTCARLPDSTVVCWGANSFSQLGVAPTALSQSSIPIAVTSAGGVAQVETGNAHTCARKADGTVMCWGLGEHGQTGFLATSGSLPRPVAGLIGVTSIAEGNGDHSCVLKSDGNIACWGFNLHGQLGNGKSAFEAVTAPQTVLTD